MAVPAETFPQHPSPWTLDEVLAMPEDSGQRVELVDGAVFVSPAPSPRHQRLLHRMQLLLGEARFRPIWSCCLASTSCSTAAGCSSRTS